MRLKTDNFLRFNRNRKFSVRIHEGPPAEELINDTRMGIVFNNKPKKFAERKLLCQVLCNEENKTKKAHIRVCLGADPVIEGFRHGWFIVERQGKYYCTKQKILLSRSPRPSNMQLRETMIVPIEECPLNKQQQEAIIQTFEAAMADYQASGKRLEKKKKTLVRKKRKLSHAITPIVRIIPPSGANIAMPTTPVMQDMQEEEDDDEEYFPTATQRKSARVRRREEVQAFTEDEAYDSAATYSDDGDYDRNDIDRSDEVDEISDDECPQEVPPVLSKFMPPQPAAPTFTPPPAFTAPPAFTLAPTFIPPNSNFSNNISNINANTFFGGFANELRMMQDKGWYSPVQVFEKHPVQVFEKQYADMEDPFGSYGMAKGTIDPRCLDALPLSRSGSPAVDSSNLASSTGGSTINNVNMTNSTSNIANSTNNPNSNAKECVFSVNPFVYC